MSNNARRITRKQLREGQRLVTRDQLGRLVQLIDAKLAEFHAALEAERKRPWWKRFLGING